METYHHHIEAFMIISYQPGIADLDLKKNLEAKIILCERAEQLLLESSIVVLLNCCRTP